MWRSCRPDIAAGKTARTRPQKGRTGATTGGRAVASRTIGMLSTILELARKHKMVEQNVARDVRRFPDVKRTRYLSVEEIVRFGTAMREAEHEGWKASAFGAIKALLLTGCRKSEILALPWAWLDPTARCIRFADTKTGPQIRPLGSSAVKHLMS